MKRACLIVPVLIAAVLFAIITQSHAAEYKGRIVDADTGEPIEGVVVLIGWRSTLLHSSYREIYDVKEILSDKDGEFKISDHKVNLNPLRTIDEPPELTIFKGGYQNVIGFWDYKYFKKLGFPIDGSKVTFKLKTADRNERLQILREGLLVWPDEYEPLLSKEVNKERKSLGIIR